VQGLTAVVAVQEPRGDYESAGRVLSVETDHVVLSYSLKSGSVSGVKSMRARRTVLTKDLLNARVYRMTYSAADPEAFPGSTSLGVSNAIYRELQDPGRSKIDLFAGVDAVGAMLAAADALPSDLTGELVRASEEPVGVPVLVNGKRVWLPAVYVKGDFEGMIRTVPVELWLLADEKNPLTLRAHVDKAQIQMVRIDFPDVPAKSAIETALAEKRPLEMWGVYFQFASAALEPESASVLDEVAGVLRAHPDWRVRIEGHTDNVGNDAHNLELSKLRAEAVRAALASRLGNGAAVVDAAGYGESRPRESNDTLAGRARNRRVEMLRQ
jgi:outer membrane protein OmpA-like peptidoglycan-associated protein